MSGETTARDMLVMLGRHYLPEGRPPAGILAKEIGSPNGARRADAIWLPVTATRGTAGMVGHEVKVSRQDVLVELSDPTKADPWMRYCHRWWLTISNPDLVDGLDIPDLWGVMAPPSGRRTRSMTIIKPAPQLHPHEPALGVQRVASWYFHNARQELSNAKANTDYHKAEADRLRTDLQRLRAQGIRNSDPHAERTAAILKAIAEARCSEDRYGILEATDAEAIARTVLNYERVKRAVGEAARTVDSVLGQLTQARTALKVMQGVLAETGDSLLSPQGEEGETHP